MADSARFLPDYTDISLADPNAPAWTSMLRGVRRLAPMDTLLIHRRQRGWLRRKLSEPFEGPTIVITHHAPHRGSLARRYAQDWVSGAFVSELRDAFFEAFMLWVHGHKHQSFDYHAGRCRVVSNPRGYVNWHGDPENGVFKPGFVIDVPPKGGRDER